MVAPSPLAFKQNSAGPPFQVPGSVSGPLSVAKEVNVETDQSDHAMVTSSEYSIGTGNLLYYKLGQVCFWIQNPCTTANEVAL